MTAPDSPLAEALRDRYLLQRELGRGGMATVYLAHDLRHDRPVALKVLRADLGAALGPERFLREIHTTARLQHPHILPIFDSGAAAGRLWFTMPYVGGESLRGRLRREVQLPVEDAIRITRETALALDHAHRHRVVHRDIKPENILLSDGQALVADFGVARALEQGAEGLTETGLALGTPMYMSPEQASGGRVDARADIYALGSVLYEMLTGEPPFTGATPQAVFAKRLAGDIPRARALRPTVPETVDRVIARALAPASADRFATAAELARALDEAMVSTGSAPPTTVAAAAPRLDPGRTRRSPRALILGLLALLVIAAAVLLRPRQATAVDANLLAVAPFDVLDPRLPLWREGMVDLLARTLDGAGSLRTVPPTAAVRQWRGRADPEAAGEFARRFGARLAVFGTVVPAGDSVRLRAAMLDVARARIVAEVEVPASAEDMAGAADSAALALLRGLGAERPVGAVRSASLGTRSVPALKAFLQGEQLYRRGDWSAAIEAYRRATELDTGFALAYFHRAGAEGWYAGAGDTLRSRLYLRAAALNRGLSPRESLLVAAESLSAAVSLSPDDPGNWRRLRRQRDLLEAATRLYPADPEAWYTLADAGYHYHFGPGLGTRTADVAALLDRALAADSAFAPAYFHRIQLALGLEGPGHARGLITRYLALRPSTYDAEALRVLEVMLDSTADDRGVGRLLDALTPDALMSSFSLTQSWPDTAAIMVVRTMARLPPVESRRLNQPSLPSAVLAMRGRVREALRTRPTREADVAFAGELGGLPADSVRAAMRRYKGPPWPYVTWLVAQRDTATLASLVRVADSAARERGQGAPTRRSLVDPHASRLFLALAKGDTAGALAAVSAIPDTLAVGNTLRLAKAQLLAARGSDREAAEVLEGAPCCRITPLRVLLDLERARIAERLHDVPRAIEGYRYVVGMWRHADPELQPFVAEARQGLERLTAEPRP